MANTKSAVVLGGDAADGICPASTPGTLGINDQADPNVLSQAGDSPGPAGMNDAGSQLTCPGPSAPAASRRRTLTPLEFEALYHQVYVPYVDPKSGMAGGTTVNVHCYRNQDPLMPKRHSNTAERDVLVALLKDEVRQAAGTLIGVQESDKQAIAGAFYGKGSPAEYAATLGYALRYRRSSLAGLATYCDEQAKLGIDCSGFVNQYFLATGKISAAQGIDVYAQKAVRTQASEIKNLDVLIWLDYSHIAVIDHGLPNSKQFVVVESAGSKGGLTHSTYSIREVNKDAVFKVHRGGSTQDVAQVYIVAAP